MAARRPRLAQRRRTVGFTQETLAEELGVDSTTVRRWETGETQTGPQPWLRPKLARCLQVTLDELQELFHEPPTTENRSEDPHRDNSDTGDTDPAAFTPPGPRQTDQHRPEHLDRQTKDPTTTAATSRPAAPATAHTRTEQPRVNPATSSLPNRTGPVPPTGHDALDSLVATVAAELTGSLAGPLLHLALLSTPTPTTPSIEYTALLRTQLHTFLDEWANTMHRREHLRLLGKIATTVDACPLRNLDSDEQERLSKVIA